MPSDLGLTGLHLRVDRNGLQMNQIRSICSGVLLHLIEELKQLYISFKISILEEEKHKHQKTKH